MKNIYLTLFLFSFIFSFQNLTAQKNFKSGFIVNNQNETIRGYIKDKTDYEFVNEIEFKEGLSGNTVIYGPEDVLSFQFKSGRSFEQIYQKKDSSYVFGKKYIQGKIDLFVIRRSKHGKSDFYLYNNEINESVYLTSPKKVRVTKDGKEYTGTSNNVYNEKLRIIKEESSERKKIKYREKLIIREIADYNKNYKDSYPINSYKDDIVNSYEISVGTAMILFPSGEPNFRISFTRNKMNKDKSRKVSYFNSISYSLYNEEIGIYQEPLSSYIETYHTLRVVPFGVKFQTNTEKVIPYFFTGIGLGAYYIENLHNGENVSNGGNNIGVFPTILLGGGVKFKVGSNYIFTEIIPQFPGVIHLNFGYSF